MRAPEGETYQDLCSRVLKHLESKNLSPDITAIYLDIAGGLDYRQIAEHHQISHATFYRRWTKLQRVVAEIVPPRKK